MCEKLPEIDNEGKYRHPNIGSLRALSHKPALPVPAPAPDAMLSNGVFHTWCGPAEMPASAPTFGNAVGTTAGLSVTMFLNEPFHTQVESCR